MYHKKSGWLVSGTTAQFSEPVALGGDNTAMFEVWLTSGSSVTTLTAGLQGSNDLVNWSSNLTSTSITSTSAPRYKACTYSTVIPYSHVRLELSFASGSPTGLIDVAINTFRTN
jgi:hypothetical protein